MNPTPSRPRRTSRDARSNHQVEEILDLLGRRKWMILLAVLIGGGAAFFLISTSASMYSTSAIVLVDLDRSSGGGSTLDAPDPFVRDSRSVMTELFVLNASKGIRERVADRFDNENPQASVSFSLADRNVSSGIKISATSYDPELAAAYANAYAEEYVAQTQIASRSYLTTTREFLEEQADRLRGDLNSADAAVEGRMAASGGAALGSGALLSQLSTLRAQLGEAQIDRQMRVNQLASIENQLEDITPRLAERVSSETDRRITAIDTEITQLETELRVFEQRESVGETIDEPRARAIRNRLAALRREKTSLGERFVDEVMGAGGIAAPTAALSYVTNLQEQAAQERIALSGLDGRIAQLRSRIGQVSGELGRAPSQTISLERASQDREAASSTYATVAAQLEQIRVQEASEPGYARILREATVPWAPMGPGWHRMLLLGLGLGLGAGVALAIAKDKLDNRVYKPQHVAAIGLPVLEAVPDLSPVIKEVLGGADTVKVGDHDVVSELVTVHAPLSPASETYRHLRTAIQFSRPDTVVEVLLVTSAAAGEGKSTTAANLAAAFAQGGRTTVIIDADLRRPRVHDVFGVRAKSGFYQMTQAPPSNAAEMLAVLRSRYATGIDDLFVVPAGALALETRDEKPDDGRPTIANPAEILGSPAARRVVDLLREAVDVVVIDTPPVLVATDAVLLSTQADATVLVASSGVSKTGDIEQALTHLDDVGARVVGAVLNRFTLDKALGYAYTYGHYSRYGAYSKYSAYTKRSKKKKSRFGRKKTAPTTTAR